MLKWWSRMLPLNWLRKGHPNQIQAHVRGDGSYLLQWIRERLSHAPHGVAPRFSHVCLLASDAQARNTMPSRKLCNDTYRPLEVIGRSTNWQPMQAGCRWLASASPFL